MGDGTQAVGRTEYLMSNVLSGTRTVGRNGHLFAKLQHRGSQWVLCVFVLVQFQFEVAESARQRNAKEWTDSEMDDWADHFIRSAENTFSYQWSLEAFALDLRAPTIVDVELVVVDVTEESLSSTEHVFTAIVTRGSKERPQTFDKQRKPQVQLRETDVSLKPSHGGEGLAQRLTDHEIAHCLGLSHPRCQDEDLYCYGDPKTAEGQSVTGLGATVTQKDYVVFAEIMGEITPTKSWRVRSETFRSQEPRPFRYMKIPGPKPDRLPGPARSHGLPLHRHTRHHRKH